MKSFYFVAYLVMACAFFVEAAKNIQISFPNDGYGVTVNEPIDNLMITTSEYYYDGDIIDSLPDDIPFKECVYDVNNNNVICKFTANHNNATKYMKVTFIIKNKPTCTLTNKSKFTKVKSLAKVGKKYIQNSYSAYYSFDKKFTEVFLDIDRFVITVNSGCTFNADISKMRIATVKKSEY